MLPVDHGKPPHVGLLPHNVDPVLRQSLKKRITRIGHRILPRHNQVFEAIF
jgi:hypothetical protein